MPKLKTHKASAKRFKVTGSGKIMRKKVGSSHLKRNKAKRVKRLFGKKLPVSKTDVKRIRRLLGKGGA